MKKVFRAEILISILALIGLIDSIYLTIHHYTAKPVPCSIVEGCEKVLTSQYATIFDIPIAIFGAIAYALALFLAILIFYGYERLWLLLLLQTLLMAGFSAWLVYLQAFVIEAFCQFCLLSAATSTFIFLIASLKNLRNLKPKN
ncbi:MAG: vitamin K epoxide reductase family protein [Pyrinomonadaceae bacterium]|nr:vitamin K epoxide reductase family protein [Pyrinomonadaceae bacterium]MCX7640842.1 vitamin K epoxide reductase family protein [Pyrinomonadaceae bacterium]MDW8303393.1 vitamin K epoxide reductase family protein [Acidobacteriota bacterium]